VVCHWYKLLRCVIYFKNASDCIRQTCKFNTKFHKKNLEERAIVATALGFSPPRKGTSLVPARCAVKRWWVTQVCQNRPIIHRDSCLIRREVSSSSSKYKWIDPTIRIDELPGCCDVVRCVDYIVAKFRALSVQSWRRSEPTVYDKIVTLYLINSNSPWNFGSLFSRRFGTARMGLYGRRPSQPRPILAVPNVTAHPSTASIGLQITVLLYNGPLLCGFNAPIKGVNKARVTGQDDPLQVTVLDHVCYCVCDDVC